MDNKRFIPGKSYIPVSGAKITDEDKQVLHEVIDGGWYTEGKWCKRFEDNLKEITGKKYVRLVNSGSSASLVAMTAALKKFDLDHERPYVLTTALAFPTTIAPIYQNGRIPLYVDIEPETLQPRLQQIFSTIASRGQEISGAIFTHTMGFSFPEEYIKTMVLSDETFLISDCCDALGTQAKRFLFDEHFPVGHYADLSTYSFFPAHHITAGEGGAVATDDPELDELVRSFSNWGRSCYCEPGQKNTCGHRFDWKERGELPDGWDHKYVFDGVGYNLKMTEFQAALGWSQSNRLEALTQKRKDNYRYLYTNMLTLHETFFLIELPIGASPFGFPLLRNENAPFTTNEFVQYLEDHKVGTRRMFGGNITKQPAFMNLPHKKMYDLSGTDRVMNDMIWIGCHPELTKEMLNCIIETINDFIKEK